MFGTSLADVFHANPGVLPSGNRKRGPARRNSFLRSVKMTKSAITGGKLHNKQWLSPATLIRVGSILIVGLMIGHMSAYPWTSIKAPQETQLTRLMKSVPFEFMGQHSTYWNLYFGWGVLVAVLLLALASILWILPDLATLRPRSAGAISATLTGATTQLLRQRKE